MVFSITGVSVKRSTRAPSQPTARPIATPTSTAKVNFQATSATVKAEPTAATATWYAVRAVASFIIPSPPSRVTRRRGRPSLPAIWVAATESGGDTMAPRAKATAQFMSPTMEWMTTATTVMVATTRPTAKKRMGRSWHVARVPRCPARRRRSTAAGRPAAPARDRAGSGGGSGGGPRRCRR